MVILDASPGTSCPVVETMRGADFVLLVTEPTPFGLHDLRLTVQVARDELGLPVGVVVNRDGVGDAGVDEYCAAEGIPILMRIPLDRRIAEAISEGQALVEALPEYRPAFQELYQQIARLVAGREMDRGDDHLVSTHRHHPQPVRRHRKRAHPADSGQRGFAARSRCLPSSPPVFKDLDGFSHIILLYHFHRVTQARLTVVPFLDREPTRACLPRARRAARIPIGLSVVRLLGIEGNVLHVENVDIVDGTPLLDIKPYVPAFDHARGGAHRAGWRPAARQVKENKSDDRFK